MDNQIMHKEYTINNLSEIYAQLNDARFIIANEGMYKSYIEFENKAVTILDKAEKYL
jgi:hypothetical protein